MKHHWQVLSFTEFTLEQLYAVLRLRQEVFAVEQQSIYLDLDNRDQQALHMLCTLDDQVLAYQRMLPPGLSFPDSSMGRIVVSPTARGLQLGKQLTQRGIDFNRETWPASDIRINAQLYLKVFYEELGFVVQGEEYDEDGIPHIQMLYRVI